eukprot:gene18411-biopygen3937
MLHHFPASALAWAVPGTSLLCGPPQAPRSGHWCIKTLELWSLAQGNSRNNRARASTSVHKFARVCTSVDERPRASTSSLASRSVHEFSTSSPRASTSVYHATTLCLSARARLGDSM